MPPISGSFLTKCHPCYKESSVPEGGSDSNDGLYLHSLTANAPDIDGVVFVEAGLATTDKAIVTVNLAHYPPEFLHARRALMPAQVAAEFSARLHP